MDSILICGGAGFIGSNFIHYLFSEPGFKGQVINCDKLTYAGNLDNLALISEKESGRRYTFIRGDIGNRPLLKDTLARFRPGAIVNFAAESHVDRSIDAPLVFVETNVKGTVCLLEEALLYWKSLAGPEKDDFRFLHVSTDEVFGSLGESGRFSESTPYRPNSPYAASKAASDHFLRAWHQTFGLPVLLGNCSNNYGPYQFPEKLIPLMIINCLQEQTLPVYGRGENIRDWLYVEDHCRALWRILQRGEVGQSYNIGGGNELKNIEVVESICAIMDELVPLSAGRAYRELISFVTDRPGHDFRYAVDYSKIKKELGWQPQHDFSSGLKSTVAWYLENRDWWQAIREKKYNLERLGNIKS